MDGGWRQRRPRKWAIDLRRCNNNAFFWYTYNKALLEEHHRMYDGLSAATAVVVLPTWTPIFCCCCSSSSEHGERCCCWRRSAIWRTCSSLEDIVVEAYPFSGCWIGNGEEVFGNACTSFLRCCCSAEADRFWKDLYNKALLCCSPEADFGSACPRFIMHAAYLRRRFLEGLIAQASNLHPLKQFHRLHLITLCESIVLFHICIPVKPFCA